MTVPSLWAVSGCSIFIASRITTVSPALTWVPSAATIFTIVPCIGVTSESPLAAPPRPPARRVLLRDARARSGDPLAAPAAADGDRTAGTVTFSLFPPTSTVIASRAGGSLTGVAGWGSNVVVISVSIQRVCTPR